MYYFMFQLNKKIKSIQETFCLEFVKFMSWYTYIKIENIFMYHNLGREKIIPDALGKTF